MSLAILGIKATEIKLAECQF